ncbi:hypothetical protein H072_8917 [Dactylellina haptotyla CBS 200.50]|uniref:Uncharacterized protein n=1 Tax=Dactylellina haptotyla (strain CBS 200.50) TaxID=1284197 RepID=S8A8H7_DACHA|nr:hypothetical protein H072_8917 [Dactylellina haptotyla CBS 200.50]
MSAEEKTKLQKIRSSAPLQIMDGLTKIRGRPRRHFPNPGTRVHSFEDVVMAVNPQTHDDPPATPPGPAESQRQTAATQIQTHTRAATQSQVPARPQLQIYPPLKIILEGCPGPKKPRRDVSLSMPTKRRRYNRKRDVIEYDFDFNSPTSTADDVKSERNSQLPPYVDFGISPSDALKDDMSVQSRSPIESASTRTTPTPTTSYRKSSSCSPEMWKPSLMNVLAAGTPLSYSSYPAAPGLVPSPQFYTPTDISEAGLLEPSQPVPSLNAPAWHSISNFDGTEYTMPVETPNIVFSWVNQGLQSFYPNGAFSPTLDYSFEEERGANQAVSLPFLSSFKNPRSPTVTTTVTILSASPYTSPSTTSSSDTPTNAASLRREKRLQASKSAETSGKGGAQNQHAHSTDLDSLRQEGGRGVFGDSDDDASGGGAGGSRSQSRRRPAHVSKRTAQAILYALEEAIRTPYSFTRDLVEEKASMSALINPSQPSRPPAGRAAPPSAAASAAGPSSPQSNIFVPDYPVSGFSPTNPNYFENPGISSQSQTQQQPFRTPRTQPGPSSQKNSPQDKRSGKQSANVRIPDTRGGNQHSSSSKPQERTPQQQQQQQQQAPQTTPQQQQQSRTQPTSSAAAMGGASTAAAAAAAAGPGVAGPSGINSSQRVGGSGAGMGGGYGTGGIGGMGSGGGGMFNEGGATGMGTGGVGGSGAAGGGKGSPPDNRQRRPSESTRGPKLLTTGNQPNSTVSAATTGASPFPHAFERWEMLSAQWEGLTRYWNRRLEQHQEEISRDPLAVQMSRNITDLSAAGANLFHAVVELQRLRASSERKFQRWFFETKADQERSREMTSELENTLRNERQKRADAMAKIAKLEKEKGTAEKLVEEARRELQISREEARRAWEELGRREQEERERTNSLRGGHPTLVGGVQVLPMPMPGVPNRGAGGGGGGSSNGGAGGARSRTSTSGPPQSSHGHPPVAAAVVQPISQPTGPTGDVVHPASPQYSAEALSEENAYVGQGDDGYHVPTLHHEPHLPEVPSPPPMGGQPSGPTSAPYYPSSSSQQSARGPSDPAAFYQQVQQPYLHQVPERTFSPGEESLVSEPGRPSSQASVTISDPGSDDEIDPWARDEEGRVFRDERGRAMTQSQVEHRRQQAAYQHPQAQPYQYYPPAGQQQQQPPPPPPPGQQGQQGQYSGYGPGWEGITRHHHPTRLSEILEEEERTNTSLSGDEGPRRRG